MLRSLLSRARWAPARCWYRLQDLWYGLDRAALLLCAAPLAVAGMATLLGRFAYTEHMALRAAQEHAAELRCLAENVYHEGRGEPLKGQYAVAEVTMNRVASPRYPDTVCGVVHEKRLDPERGRYVGAFSWTEIDVRVPGGPAWQRAVEVAKTVHEARHEPVVPGALHYHSVRIKPRWAKSKPPLARIGNHIFYP